MNLPNILHICSSDGRAQEDAIQDLVKKYCSEDTSFVYWDQELYEKLVVKHYPEFIDIFNQLEFTIEKSFLGRLLALNKYGGLIMSSYMNPIKKLDNFISKCKWAEGAYIKSHKTSTILFEQKPWEFFEKEKISNQVMISEADSPFLDFCLNTILENKYSLSEKEEFKLSLQDVDVQSDSIESRLGAKLLYRCLMNYYNQFSNHDTTVLPYYYINPCMCRSKSDEKQIYIFNSNPTEVQEQDADREWEAINTEALGEKAFNKSFMYDTKPSKKIKEAISTKVAMIAWQFPNRANTFVMNEVMEMHRRGVDLTIYSMSFPTAECKIIYKDELKQIGHKIICVPQNKLINHQKIQEDRIAFFQNEFRLNLNLGKTIDPGSETFNQQEQECVQNSSGFLEKFIEDIKSRGIQKIYAPFANGDAEIAMMISYHTGIPYYFTAHAYDLFSSYHYARMKAKTVSHVFAISEYNKNYLIEQLGIPEERITVRRINFLAPVPSEIKDKSLNMPYILSAGRIDEMKGFEYSIKAFAEFRKKYPEVHYVIVGTGSLESKIKKLILDLGLLDYVHLAGHIKNHEVLELAKGAEFSILSSIEMPNKDKEGLPTCFVESMSLGTPCIGTDYSGTPELIDHGINGMLTKEKDVNDINIKMCELYEMIKEDNIGSISGSCKAKVENMFNNEENVKLLLEHLK